MTKSNLFSISKTLRFSLIPIGKTETNFDAAQVLKNDERRAQIYVKVKSYIDDYHRAFIERCLSTLNLRGIDEYAQLYYKKSESVEAEKEKMEDAFRNTIAKHFKSASEFNSLFDKELIREILPRFLKDDTQKQEVDEFYYFTTYFSGFHENRKNIYKSEKKPTAVAYRCIHDNLPRFLDNAKIFERISLALGDDLSELKTEMAGLCKCGVDSAFDPDNFNFFLSQKGIIEYNSILGGYTTSDNRKIKGLNEYINLYNQNAKKVDKLPFMKPLYRQILSNDETISFVPEKFKTDNEMLKSIHDFYINISSALDEIKDVVEKFADYEPKGVFVKNGANISGLSKSVYGDWSKVQTTWENEYDAQNEKSLLKNYEKHSEKRKKAFKAIKGFSFAELDYYGNKNAEEVRSIAAFFENKLKELLNLVKESFEKAKKLLTTEYKGVKRLSSDESAIETIKDFLDSIKSLEMLIKPLFVADITKEKDETFYGDITPVYDKLSSIDRLYDKVRNYLTEKPYSNDKIKLNFDNPQLLGGWDKNKESDYRCVLLKKEEDVYLAIMDRASSKAFENIKESKEANYYQKMEYKLLPGPNKMLPKVFFSRKGIEYFNPSAEIKSIYEAGSFKKGENFSLKDCHKLIDFYKESIANHPDWNQFGFEFRNTNDYADIGEFYNDVRNQGYKIGFKNISATEIEELVNNGYIYLFRLYNKDFSPNSKGTPNLHTLYFKMLFDQRNLSNVVYKLNGEAEMFYRKPSIKKEEMIVHPANRPIKRKNLDHRDENSIFVYDIIKDKRYTKRQFLLHIPITMNFSAEEIGFSELNYRVRNDLRQKENNYVIGIDRGERNLLYVCVIDGNGKIVEQKSLNEIVCGENKVDYQKLLSEREEERLKSRQAWKQINSIKELKEGYLSQVVNEICKLIVKYDAIVALEDLNMGFKNSRIKVERQVYQKFEKMLISKLEFVVDKKLDAEAEGGLLKAYQFAHSKAMGRQNGRIFYVPAWLTSKVDPVTGFADLIRPKYINMEEARTFVGNIDNIKYLADADMFVFDIDYSKFKGTSADFKKKWSVHTNGERIETFRNKDKNGEWDTKNVVLTHEFKCLFDKYSISYEKNLKQQIQNQNSKEFFCSFMHFLALTLQMRNSKPNNVEVDYLISPVKDKTGKFFDTRDYENTQESAFPQNADSNGAYNIARKALWIIQHLKSVDEEALRKADIFISQKDWMEYIQK